MGDNVINYDYDGFKYSVNGFSFKSLVDNYTFLLEDYNFLTALSMTVPVSIACRSAQKKIKSEEYPALDYGINAVKSAADAVTCALLSGKLWNVTALTPVEQIFTDAYFNFEFIKHFSSNKTADQYGISSLFHSFKSSISNNPKVLVQYFGQFGSFILAGSAMHNATKALGYSAAATIKTTANCLLGAGRAAKNTLCYLYGSKERMPKDGGPVEPVNGDHGKRGPVHKFQLHKLQ